MAHNSQFGRWWRKRRRRRDVTIITGMAYGKFPGIMIFIISTQKLIKFSETCIHSNVLLAEIVHVRNGSHDTLFHLCAINKAVLTRIESTSICITLKQYWTKSIHHGSRVNGTEWRTDAPIYEYKIHSNHSKRKLIEPFQLNDLTKDKRPSPQRQSNAFIHIIIIIIIIPDASWLRSKFRVNV